MVKYLSRFAKDLSEMCKPLRKFTHKDAEWSWTSAQENALKAIKQAVTQAPVLKYFEANTPTEGQGDASQSGLGFVLMQDDHPVTYASRALTPAEQRYSQIEKELLAQVFGMEHNHEYVYGRRVVLWTDHKPLFSIHKKPLSLAPKRLQRLLLRLQQYDVEIKYKPGAEMYLADTLSRAYLNEYERSSFEEEVESICAATFLPIAEPQLREIQHETVCDPTLQILKRVIINGWPDQKNEVPVQLHPYFIVRDELSAQDGIIFKGQKCVIPMNLREKIKAKLHGAHTGLQGTLRRAREAVYWPGMNKELSDYVSRCEICSSYQTAQPKEPLICHDVPERPWEKIGVDIFTVDSKDYLCTADYYSNYFEVDHLANKTVSEITKKLRRHFSTHGIPNKVCSDNSPFNSAEFEQFTKSYEFEHITSSPTYPQSNGKVENAIKTAKRLMKKATESGVDFYLALLEWRNIPSEGYGSSPVQRMFGRRTRTLLPMASSLLKPKIEEDVKKKIYERKEKQTRYYNKGTKQLTPLVKGDIVRVHPKPGDKQHKWFKAKVEDQVDIRSYDVRTEDGRVFRRNRRHLRSRVEPFYPVTEVQHTPVVPQTTQSAITPTSQNVLMKPTSTTNSETPSAFTGTVNKQTPVVVVQPSASHQETKEPASNPNVTRSGRVLKPPSHLKDYVT